MLQYYTVIKMEKYEAKKSRTGAPSDDIGLAESNDYGGKSTYRKAVDYVKSFFHKPSEDINKDAEIHTGEKKNDVPKSIFGMETGPKAMTPEELEEKKDYISAAREAKRRGLDKKAADEEKSKNRKRIERYKIEDEELRDKIEDEELDDIADTADAVFAYYILFG